RSQILIFLLVIWAAIISFVSTDIKEVCPKSSGYIIEPTSNGAPISVDILTDFVFPCRGKLVGVDFYDSMGIPFKIGIFQEQILDDGEASTYSLNNFSSVIPSDEPGYHRHTLNITVEKGDVLGIMSSESDASASNIGIHHDIIDDGEIPTTDKYYNTAEVELGTRANNYHVIRNKNKSYSIRIFYANPNEEFNPLYTHKGCNDFPLSTNPNIVQLTDNDDQGDSGQIEDPIYKCYLKALDDGKTIFGLKERHCYVEANNNNVWIDNSTQLTYCSGIGNKSVDVYEIHTDNAAIGKQVYQSSETWIKKSSQNALLLGLDSYKDSCSISLTSNEINPYWIVFIGEDVRIMKLVITPTKEYPLRNFAIYIDKKLCTIYNGEITTPHKVTCDNPLHGGSVKIQMMGDNPTQLALCYVEVYTTATCPVDTPERLISGDIPC
ncbi:unnamed protein product, partial [Owenia fusiformis]